VALLAGAVALQAAEVGRHGQRQGVARSVAGLACPFGGGKRVLQRGAVEAATQVVAGQQHLRAPGGAVVAIGARDAGALVALQRHLRRFQGIGGVALGVGQGGAYECGVCGQQRVVTQAAQRGQRRCHVGGARHAGRHQAAAQVEQARLAAERFDLGQRRKRIIGLFQPALHLQVDLGLQRL